MLLLRCNDLKHYTLIRAVSEEQAIPVVYIDEKAQAHWAYKVSVLVNYKKKIPERPTAIIAADNL